MRYRLVALNCRYTHSCPAIFYVREALIAHGAVADFNDIELLQLTINDPYYQTLLKVSENRADALFFSAYIWNGEYLRRLLSDLSRLCPGLPLIIGGPQAEFIGKLPKECSLITGGIEAVDPEFYHDLSIGRLQPSYRCRPGSDFPFPYREDDFSSHLKNRQILYESSRGCPFSCSYCLSSVDKGVVRKPVKQVQEELQLILATEPPLIKFVDRTFNDNPARALQLWKFIVDRYGKKATKKTRFHFEVAPDRFTEESLTFLSTVPTGLFQFEIGIQSTDNKVLTAIKRKMAVIPALVAIKRLSAAKNIHIHVDLILGLPEDTYAGFADSFRNVFACSPHHIQMGLLKVLPATPIAADCRQYGLVHCTNPPYEILATASMGAAEIRELYLFGECVERFYNNRYFPSFFDYLRGSGEDIFAFFSGLLIICKKREFFQRAATQEFLNSLLTEYLTVFPFPRRNEGTSVGTGTIKKSGKVKVLKELLIFDWLRTGHRFLPECLSRVSLADIRSRLRVDMPMTMEPFFTERERNRFFKQGIFYIFSGETLVATGLSKRQDCSSVVCFLPENDLDLFNLRCCLVLSHL